MPERSFFDLRYAVPGYTLILLIIGINYVPLFEITRRFPIQSETLGAFLGFLSLLGGSALGFLISQVWWWSFQRNLKEYGMCEKLIETLIDKYKLNIPQKAEEKRGIITICDYVIHSNKEEKIFRYVERRWDMYHLLSSEWYTLIVGSILGIFYRVLSHFVLFKSPVPSFRIITNLVEAEFWIKSEFWIVLIIFVHVVFLGCLLRKGRDEIVTQHSAMSVAVIKKSEIKTKDLVKIFPTNYFSLTSIRGIDNKTAEKLREEGIISISALAETDPKELSKKTGMTQQTIFKWITEAQELLKEE